MIVKLNITNNNNMNEYLKYFFLISMGYVTYNHIV